MTGKTDKSTPRPAEKTTEQPSEKFGSARSKGPDRRSPLAREIDENLKRVYAAHLNEDVPDRFRLLLDQLRDKEGKP